MIRRFKVGYARRAAQAHAGARAAVADRPRRRARSPASTGARRRRRARQRAGRSSTASQALAIRTDTGIDLLCDGRGHRGAGRRAARARRRARRRGGRRVPAHRERAAALRRRPRRERDPAGGRAQRARGELHQGLLRRPGDGRAPLLQGQAQPPPARAAPVGRRPRRGAELRLGEREVGRLGERRRSRPGSARSGSLSCAARRSRARCCVSPADADRAPRSSSCPSLRRPEAGPGRRAPHPLGTPN